MPVTLKKCGNEELYYYYYYYYYGVQILRVCSCFMSQVSLLLFLSLYLSIFVVFSQYFLCVISPWLPIISHYFLSLSLVFRQIASVFILSLSLSSYIYSMNSQCIVYSYKSCCSLRTFHCTTQWKERTSTVQHASEATICYLLKMHFSESMINAFPFK